MEAETQGKAVEEEDLSSSVKQKHHPTSYHALSCPSYVRTSMAEEEEDKEVVMTVPVVEQHNEVAENISIWLERPRRWVRPRQL